MILEIAYLEPSCLQMEVFKMVDTVASFSSKSAYLLNEFEVTFLGGNTSSRLE